MKNDVNFGYGFDEQTADWWCHRKISEALDANVRVCLFFGNMMDKTSLHLYSKLIINNISCLFNKNEDANLYDFLFTNGYEILEFLYKNKTFPIKYLTDIVLEYCETNMYYRFTSFEELVKWKPYDVVNNESELETICNTVINDNPKSVSDYRKGKKNSINHLKGQVIKLTKGKADVKLVTEILERKLNYD